MPTNLIGKPFWSGFAPRQYRQILGFRHKNWFNKKQLIGMFDPILDTGEDNTTATPTTPLNLSVIWNGSDTFAFSWDSSISGTPGNQVELQLKINTDEYIHVITVNFTPPISSYMFVDADVGSLLVDPNNILIWRIRYINLGVPGEWSDEARSLGIPFTPTDFSYGFDDPTLIILWNPILNEDHSSYQIQYDFDADAVWINAPNGTGGSAPNPTAVGFIEQYLFTVGENPSGTISSWSHMRFRVRAINDGFHFSAWSNIVNINPLVIITDLDASINGILSVDLTWTAPNEGGVAFQRNLFRTIQDGIANEFIIGFSDDSENFYSDDSAEAITAIIAEKTITYYLLATNTAGDGPTSNEAIAHP